MNEDERRFVFKQACHVIAGACNFSGVMFDVIEKDYEIDMRRNAETIRMIIAELAAAYMRLPREGR